MSQSKTSMKTIVRYLRDFSIVVAGIAVTLYVNDKISNRSEKRDLKLYMNAVILELEENIKELEDQIANEQKPVGYANYLNSRDINSAKDVKSVDKDSVISYIEGIYLIQTVTYKTNAFEMFKLSGTMRLVENKELLLSIWKSYTHLDEVRKIIDMGYQFKLEEAKKELQLSPAERERNIPMYSFYTQTPWTIEFQRHWKGSIEMLKETIKEIEKAL